MPCLRAGGRLDGLGPRGSERRDAGCPRDARGTWVPVHPWKEPRGDACHYTELKERVELSENT